MTSGRTAWVAAAGVAGVSLTALIVGLAVSTRTTRYEATVVLREGWTQWDFAAALEAAGVVPAAAFLEACRDPVLLAAHGIDAADAEGYLFPDSYRFFVPMPAREVVDRLLDGFDRKARPVLEAGGARLGELAALTRMPGPRAALILASLVEAETAAAAERPRVSSVLWNRLRKIDLEVTRLQVDPTASYGCRRSPESPSCVGWRSGPPTRKMLDDATNAYNTYRRDGLPPGPINNPGLASLRAALAPEDTRFLFYVSRGDGTHQFSRTYPEHQQAVRRFLGRR